jgi:hypothetical protein
VDVLFRAIDAAPSKSGFESPLMSKNLGSVIRTVSSTTREEAVMELPVCVFLKA